MRAHSTLSPELVAAYRFFQVNRSCYAVGYHAAGALELAKAEAAGRDKLAFSWLNSDLPWDGDYAEPDPEKYQAVDCIAYASCPCCGKSLEIVASLGSVYLKRWNEDPMRRVVEAELAIEALS